MNVVAICRKWTGLWTFVCCLFLTDGQDFKFSNTDHYLMSVIHNGRGTFDCLNQRYLHFLKDNQQPCLFCYEKSRHFKDIDIRNGTCWNFGFGCSRSCCRGVTSSIYFPTVSQNLAIVTSCTCGACPTELREPSEHDLYNFIQRMNS